jgi:plasmid stabilization system protein ParE
LRNLEALNSFPEAGRIVPEINDPKIREIFVYSYRLIYEIFPNRVEVLALIHSKRDFMRELLNT